MAEVLTHWPESRSVAKATFEYPWEQWGILDENGHGDIWLAERGIDFPATTTVSRFQGSLYNRAVRVTAKRERAAEEILKPVKVRNTRTGEISTKVKRVKMFRQFRVKVRIVSDDKIAFQFYDSLEAPPEPEVRKVTTSRRRPIHQTVTRRVLERRDTRELVSA